ncbi:MAG: glycerol kinase [Deltaproteobacteria bacterium HGW-Deltaproteobacteria-14]|jgi:glycerol kinase|nr:MAG: glycerol kinase [Deltaproteobacteria bacterium HGW-Deltaproteobacteria-14]
MAADGVILAIDQGTTGSTVVIMNRALEVVGRATTEFPQIYPQPGWVEHGPEAIWGSVEQSLRTALDGAGISGRDVRAIGITNQRETTVVWERATSRPVHNAIVWQCRRTTDVCRALKDAGHEERVRELTGLVLDPYFSGTKVAWILDRVEGARARAERGELAFGTVDSYLLWRLTGGDVHATEVSNASRTLLYDIHENAWSEELLALLRVPRAVLPDVRSSSEVFGHTRGLGFLPDGIPVAGIAGDQQAALFGQACFAAGQAKATYGTGAFVLMNTGETPVASTRGLLTTIAWRLGDGPTIYALEGAVFIAGAAVQWLRDELRVIDKASDIEALARTVPDAGGVTVVPAFAGLGAPYWDPEARGAILGLTRGSGRGHIARATLDGIAHQVADVVEAMAADAGRDLAGLRVDGGAAANDLLMQTQADLLGSEVRRPTLLESTACGAAFLAGLAVGYFAGLDDIASRWREDARFAPRLSELERDVARQRWKNAVRRLRTS